MNGVYLRPDHESIHRSFDVVRRYLLALSGVRVRCTWVGTDHLRAECDWRSDLLVIAVMFQRLMLLQMLLRYDASSTVAVVVINHELVRTHPRLTDVTRSSTHFHRLFVIIIQLDLHNIIGLHIYLQWSRQLRGIGARAPSTSSSLIFRLTSEPYKLWHSTPCSFLSSKNGVGDGTGHTVELHNIFCHP